MKITFLLVFLFIGMQQSGTWNAPKEADKILNPLKGDPKSAKAGAELYTTYCLMCHGPKGKGDGPSGVSLLPKPGNLLSDRNKQASDGSFFWKIKNAKAPMPLYPLTDNQRWSLVNYIRELQNKSAASK
jgi:mono/diheme cytochrome c family protein